MLFLRSLVGSGKSWSLWQLIELLTTLRNQVAHKTLDANWRERATIMAKIAKILPKVASDPCLLVFGVVFAKAWVTAAWLLVADHFDLRGKLRMIAALCNADQICK